MLGINPFDFSYRLCCFPLQQIASERVGRIGWKYRYPTPAQVFGRGRLAGWLAPWLISREVRAYRQLEGHPAVPRLRGRIDRGQRVYLTVMRSFVSLMTTITIYLRGSRARLLRRALRR